MTQKDDISKGSIIRSSIIESGGGGRDHLSGNCNQSSEVMQYV